MGCAISEHQLPRTAESLGGRWSCGLPCASFFIGRGQGAIAWAAAGVAHASAAANTAVRKHKRSNLVTVILDRPSTRGRRPYFCTARRSGGLDGGDHAAAVLGLPR